jgi:arsenite/tail-anchored protein-transporting ATPase
LERRTVDLASLLTRRTFLVTGKGGVGRTVVAAALARVVAGLGKQVLLTEIGDHEQTESQLAQLFGQRRFAVNPHQISPNLWACRLWAPHGHELFLRAVLPGGVIVGAALRSRVVQNFLMAAPSFVEMGWFYHMLTLLREPRLDGGFRYEVMIIDMPATGHTLALTGLPEILLRLVTHGPIVSALNEGRAFINNPAQTAALVVTLPETLPVSEAIELVEGLRRTDVAVGAVLLNRFPDDPFALADRRALEPLLDGHAVFGGHAFRRVPRSQAAYERLRAELAYPVVRIPEFEKTGSALVDAVAGSLASAVGAA